MSSESPTGIDALTIAPFIIIAIPFFATLVGTPIARDIALRFGIVDAPVEGSSKTHKKPTPYLGGLPLFIGLIVGTYIVLNQTGLAVPDDINPLWIIAAITLIFLVGLWDDLKGMIPGVKMLMLAVAGTMVFFGGARIDFVPAEWGLIGQGIVWLLTLFWILGITNSANLMDNMNGLLSGTGIVAALSIFFIALLGSDPVGIGLSLVLIGALTGYFPYNFPRASIFLGDAGSFTLGFYLSFLGLMAGRLPAAEGFHPFSHTIAPIIVVGVFVFDTFFVAFSRAKRKINFWWGGKDHTSHRLVNFGFSSVMAVILVWLIGAVFGGVGVLAKISPPWLAAVEFIVILAAGIWFWRQLEKIEVETVKIGASNVREKRQKQSKSRQ